MIFHFGNSVFSSLSRSSPRCTEKIIAAVWLMCDKDGEIFSLIAGRVRAVFI